MAASMAEGAADPNAGREDTRGRVAALRKLMAEAEGGPLDAYIIPSEDAHQSEYVALCDERRRFISGFAGSAGLALVTADQCLLWTDGRYFAQALQEMRTEWTLMRIMEDVGVEQWIAQNLPRGARVGADLCCLSVDAARRLQHELFPRQQQLVQCPENLVDAVWGSSRPTPGPQPLAVQPLQYAGVPAASKVASLQARLAGVGAHALVLSALDEVAWLLNLRGNDVPFNPVFVAYAIVAREGATLYVDPRKVTPEVSAHLEENKVSLRPYGSFFQDLDSLAQEALGAAAHRPQANGAPEGAKGGGAAGGSGGDDVGNAVEQNSSAPGVNGSSEGAGEGGAEGAGEGKGGEANGGGGEGAGAGSSSKIWICPASCSYGVLERLQRTLLPSMVLQMPSPVALAKALKNPAELDGMRAAHIRDAVALVHFFCWLDNQMQTRLGAPGYFAGAVAEAGTAEGGKRKRGDAPGTGAKVRRSGDEAELAGAHPGGAGDEGSEGLESTGRGTGAGTGAEEGPLTEASVAEVLEGLRRRQEEGPVTGASVAEVLEGLRREQELFKGPSFETISSVGPNAAIIHYKPKAEGSAELSPSQIYLCDSGGQYLDGTTDVTRTTHFGNPTAHEKKCFTRVLQGYIALETVVFPNGTTGAVLDVLARGPLWRDGLDYRHGTGHGVGSYLNVHEGPHLISFRPKAQFVPLQANMTVTDEPGYYEDGVFGVRTENVLLVKEHQCPHNFGAKGYLSMEPVTFVPIQTKLIEESLLTASEREWLNEYHEACRAKLAPLLSGETLEWLTRATEPIKA